MSVGDAIEIRAENGLVVIAAVRRHPREGWAEEARRMAEAGEDGLVWPDFPNEFDETEWRW